MGISGNRILNAQQDPLKRRVLQKVDLGDKEGTMFIAEISPGASSGKHFHPGPETFHILGGAMVLEKEGHAPMTLKAGDSGSMAAKHAHEAKNDSTAEPLKVLGYIVGDKGQPLATAITQPYFWKK